MINGRAMGFTMLRGLDMRWGVVDVMRLQQVRRGFDLRDYLLSKLCGVEVVISHRNNHCTFVFCSYGVYSARDIKYVLLRVGVRDVYVDCEVLLLVFCEFHNLCGMHRVVVSCSCA